jgi:enamine deaminase RidA (YjgF/YER057c/UK114 family)
MIPALIMRLLSTCLLSFVLISPYAQTKSPTEMLKTMGITLTTPGTPIANYVPAVRVGNLLYLSGAGPLLDDGTYLSGKIGENRTIEEGYNASRLVAIRHLGIIEAELGSLNRVKRLVKVLGLVNCTHDFANQPAVINGYSDFMVQVFGDRGKHARSAIGTHALPLNMLVEIELILEIED